MNCQDIVLIVVGSWIVATVGMLFFFRGISRHNDRHYRDDD
jgi:hypothetical protein